MRRHTKALLVVAALCSFAAIGAPAAFGAYTEVGSFAGSGSGPGGSGSGAGELSNPGQAEVNDETGNLYVADTGNDRVQVFKANATGGEYDSQAAVPGAVGLAIDQSNGDVYVATATGVSKFDEGLAPIAAGWTDPAVSGPLTVDPSTGDLLVADTAANLVRRYNSDGSADGSFAATRPIDLAADSSGDVLVVTSTGDLIAECSAESAVRRFSGAGVEEATVGATLSAPGAIAVDPDDDSIVVASRTNRYNCGSETPLISFFDAAGTETESLALSAPTQYATVPGLAVQADGSARVYAVTKSPMNDSYGATQVTLLEVPTPTAPEIESQSVLRGRESATLRATINPGGEPTTYHFEYGTTTDYEQSTAEGTLAASFQSAAVSTPISGLTRGTTYHYRVVAENPVGVEFGPDRTFTTEAVAGAGCPLPTDCRAYELVTPPDNLARIEVFGSFGLKDGDAIFFSSYDSLPGAVPNGPLPTKDSWIGRRGADGWSTEWTTDAALSEPGTLGSQTTFSNEDGSVSIMHTETGIDPGDTFAHSVDPYLRTADGTISWLTPGPRTEIEFRKVFQASPDLKRLLIGAEEPIMPGDDADEAFDIYIREDGTLRLITPNTPGDTSLSTMGENALAFPGTMSDDGSRVFFSSSEVLDPADTDVQVGDLYVREGDAYRLVSVDRRTTPDPLQEPANFFGAASDGSIACFSTYTQLEDADTDAERDLYCYDLETDVLERVSAGLDDNTAAAAEPVGLSEDGSAVFFSTAAELTVDDLDGVVSFFRREGGVTQYLGPLDPTDLSEERRVASPAANNRALWMNSDGSRLIFTSAASLLPSDTDAVPDVYRWVEGQGFTQISIGPAGGSGPGESASGSFDPLTFDSFGGKPVGGRVTTAEGKAIFFDSAEALVMNDTDGSYVDVYEWREGGEVRLVSPAGAYPADARYIDNSEDGDTVFFVTPEPVVATDVNGGVRDLYAARVGGGFPEQVPPSDCVGDGCQAPASSPPLLPRANSSTFSGRGNLAEPRRSGRGRKCGKGKRKVRVNGRSRCIPKKGKQGTKAGNTTNKIQGGSH